MDICKNTSAQQQEVQAARGDSLHKNHSETVTRTSILKVVELMFGDDAALACLSFLPVRWGWCKDQRWIIEKILVSIICKSGFQKNRLQGKIC